MRRLARISCISCFTANFERFAKRCLRLLQNFRYISRGFHATNAGAFVSFVVSIDKHIRTNVDLISGTSQLNRALPRKGHKGKQILHSPLRTISNCAAIPVKPFIPKIYLLCVVEPFQSESGLGNKVIQFPNHTRRRNFCDFQSFFFSAPRFVRGYPDRSYGCTYRSYCSQDIPDIMLFRFWNEEDACRKHKRRTHKSKKQFHDKPSFFHALSF